MSKDCGKDCGRHRRELCIRRLLYALLLLVILIAIAILIIYLVFKPTKPKFYLQDANVKRFNLTQPNLLTSELQVTISSHNPNDGISILYSSLKVYASYNYQQITLSSLIPPFNQGHKGVDVWSPYLSGEGIPIAPYLGQMLMEDEADGFFFLSVKIEGKLKWRIGSWTSGHYHLFVNCPAYLSFVRSGGSSNSVGDGVGSAVGIKFQRVSACSVDV